jgi:hypothetical protein
MPNKLAIRCLLIVSSLGFFIPWTTVHIGPTKGYGPSILQIFFKNINHLDQVRYQYMSLLIPFVILLPIPAIFLLSFAKEDHRNVRTIQILAVCGAILASSLITLLAAIPLLDRSGGILFGAGPGLVPVIVGFGGCFLISIKPFRERLNQLTSLASSEGNKGNPIQMTSGVDDIGFWDQMHSKHDHDLLEEYLARFPQGTFSELAKKRLETRPISVEGPR